MDLFSLKLELPVDILDIGTILEYLSMYTCIHIAYIKISFHQVYLFRTIVIIHTSQSKILLHNFL